MKERFYFRILLTPKKVECVSLHRLIYQACEGKLDPNFGVIRVDSDHFFNRTYRVVTIEDQPFVIKSVDPKTGAVSWSGFSIDLLEILAKKINFRYDLYEGTDYGSLRPTGPNGTMKWSGLVGDVESGRADFAVSAMTVTPQREQVVDFTKRYMGEFKISVFNFELSLDPFLNSLDYAVGILMKKKPAVSNLFSFLNPFHVTVWYSIIAGLVIVSLLLYVLNRVSPKRIRGPKACFVERVAQFYRMF